MLGDAYTGEYLNNPRIKPFKEFIALGGVSAQNGVVGTGYFGPSKHAPALVATNVEKQIGDRLVVENQSPQEVMAWASRRSKQPFDVRAAHDEPVSKSGVRERLSRLPHDIYLPDRRRDTASRRRSSCSIS
jgi:hypothetical protein